MYVDFIMIFRVKNRLLSLTKNFIACKNHMLLDSLRRVNSTKEFVNLKLLSFTIDAPFINFQRRM